MSNEFQLAMKKDVEEMKAKILDMSKAIRAQTKSMEEFLELKKEKDDD